MGLTQHDNSYALTADDDRLPCSSCVNIISEMSEDNDDKEAGGMRRGGPPM